MKISTRKKNEQGFTLIEMLIVLVVLAVMLAIALPNLLDYYWQQRFVQEVQHVAATIKTSQFTSIASSHWMAVAVHPQCPIPGESSRFCLQIFRIPAGQCTMPAWPAGPADWLNMQDCSSANLTGPVPCEFRGERWIMEAIVRPQPEVGPPVVYLIGPDQTVSFQTAVINNPVCSDLAIPNPQRQMTFMYLRGSDYMYRGICMTGRGNVKSTKTEDAVIFLSCQT